MTVELLPALCSISHSGSKEPRRRCEGVRACVCVLRAPYRNQTVPMPLRSCTATRPIRHKLAHPHTSFTSSLILSVASFLDFIRCRVLLPPRSPTPPPTVALHGHQPAVADSSKMAQPVGWCSCCVDASEQGERGWNGSMTTTSTKDMLGCLETLYKHRCSGTCVGSRAPTNNTSSVFLCFFCPLAGVPQ